ncbi:hypothetical protein [Ralstonia solanacearum]|uniref:hypothetical protein n=1 Tax=Ralstonia solanacearum TaxID=305 RepID=UPI0011D1886D|nr:hypothetical protein [Ralstonia solanacearum]
MVVDMYGPGIPSAGFGVLREALRDQAMPYIWVIAPIAQKIIYETARLLMSNAKSHARLPDTAYVGWLCITLFESEGRV